MTEETARLIQRLAAGAQPVKRLRPPVLRAALWLVAVAAIIATTISLFADFAVFARRAQDPKFAFELVGTLLTGVAAVVAAFHLSLPDRPRSWALLPLPPLALWIVSSGYSCYRSWIVAGPAGWELGETAHCLRFILGWSVPLAVSLIVLLHRSAPLAPVPVAALGGLGVAAIAAFALQFFHPFNVTFIDLGIHLGAVVIVVLATAAAERLRSQRRETLP